MVYFCYYIFIYSYYLILFFFDCFLFLSFFSSFLLSFGLFFFQSTFSPTSCRSCNPFCSFGNNTEKFKCLLNLSKSSSSPPPYNVCATVVVYFGCILFFFNTERHYFCVLYSQCMLNLLTYSLLPLLNYRFISQTFHLVFQVALGGPYHKVVLLMDFLPLASAGFCLLSFESFELFKTNTQIYFAHQLFLR